ncbi:hypothetical protein L1987_62201 [Smallanthus sonchifolius]|uniref:Uncharacterized protein n=1 Tax=Smallanthus sonchifolius TaxID=185202 RepID=A0ACB9C9R4_9ASTR|nr:hypothetical protein L1987_62201 [Smallanthus sonchifolius]
MSSSAGSNVFAGFTKLCKGLALVLVCGHIVVRIFPSALTYVALIPSRTIPFCWNLFTASYIEQTIHGVVISTIGLLFIGKLLEPIWGPREFLKFIFVVNFFTNVYVFIAAIFVYYITMEEIYLYFQRKQETKIKGDPSEEFSFSTFFPGFLRPLIDPIASVFDQMLSRRSKASIEIRGNTVGTASLPGSDPVEASTRRERGARALEERLAAERLAYVGRKVEPIRDHATEKVNTSLNASGWAPQKVKPLLLSVEFISPAVCFLSDGSIYLSEQQKIVFILSTLFLSRFNCLFIALQFCASSENLKNGFPFDDVPYRSYTNWGTSLNL